MMTSVLRPVTCSQSIVNSTVNESTTNKSFWSLSSLLLFWYLFSICFYDLTFFLVNGTRQSAARHNTAFSEMTGNGSKASKVCARCRIKNGIMKLALNIKSSLKKGHYREQMRFSLEKYFCLAAQIHISRRLFEWRRLRKKKNKQMICPERWCNGSLITAQGTAICIHDYE